MRLLSPLTRPKKASFCPVHHWAWKSKEEQTFPSGQLSPKEEKMLGYSWAVTLSKLRCRERSQDVYIYGAPSTQEETTGVGRHIPPYYKLVKISRANVGETLRAWSRVST